MCGYVQSNVVCAMQVLPLDPMCGSVKSSMAQALKQYLAVKDLSEVAAKQYSGQPLGALEHLDLEPELTKPAAASMKVKRSVSFEPPAVGIFSRESAESNSSAESEMVHKHRGNLSSARRMSSLPIDNHMSTHSLLSAEQQRASSSEVRLYIRE